MEAALDGVLAEATLEAGVEMVTVWINTATVSVEDACFQRMRNVSKVLEQEDHEPTLGDDVSAAALGMFVRKMNS